jgi:lipoprotein-anchoring transpeptidase ErfK/SrfK
MTTPKHKIKIQKQILVELKTQTLTAFDGRKQIYKFDCVTGDDTHPTNPGVFNIFLRDKEHVSKKYHVPMHYALFFTKDGKAIHQYHGPAFSLVRALKENVSDYFGSHGCVRLEEENAKTLFDWTPIGTPVHVK